MGIVDLRVFVPGRGIADATKSRAGLQVFLQYRPDTVAERQVSEANDARRDPNLALCRQRVGHAIDCFGLTDWLKLCR